jgi:hypothetical protein
MSRATKISQQLTITFSIQDLIQLIDKCNMEQKEILYKKLHNELIVKEFDRIANRVKNPSFSEEEIMEEVKAVRKKQNGK